MTRMRLERGLGVLPVALLAPQLDEAFRLVRETVEGRGTLIFCGNGGSAADAQHLATEYVVRYMKNRAAYPAISRSNALWARAAHVMPRSGNLLAKSPGQWSDGVAPKFAARAA